MYWAIAIFPAVPLTMAMMATSAPLALQMGDEMDSSM